MIMVLLMFQVFIPFRILVSIYFTVNKVVVFYLLGFTHLGYLKFVYILCGLFSSLVNSVILS